MQITFPYTISQGGEKLTFTRLIEKNGITVIEGENEVQPKAGPPMHVHYRQDESLTVISGKMGYQLLGEEAKFAYAGETVMFKAGVAHKFWNDGDELLRCSAYVTPADNFIYFITEIFKSMSANNGRPGLYDSAFLLRRYRSEFSMLEIPSFVQKIIFPIVLFFGNLAGKQKKFVDAPAPV